MSQAQSRDVFLAKRREWYRKNVEKLRLQSRVSRLQRRFGMTLDEYEAMLEAQDRRCGACRRDFDRTPSVDHDHATGQVRGLLCNRCNVAIGFAEDDPERLEAAANYLRRVNGENGPMQLVGHRDPTRPLSAVSRLS
jgi:hypothetical protein